MVCVFGITVVIYGLENGFQGIDTGGLSPTTAGLLGIAPLLFSFVGFEGQNGAAEEMKDPQKDVPSSIMRSGALAAFCYLVPISSCCSCSRPMRSPASAASSTPSRKATRSTAARPTSSSASPRSSSSSRS